LSETVESGPQAMIAWPVHNGDSALVIGRARGVALRIKVSGAEAAALREGGGAAHRLDT
jgi:hypothetical protein